MRGDYMVSPLNSNNMYTPPFTISTEAINLIAEISAQIERYVIRLEQEDGLHLRKVNRIKTVHSSLAIEGNKLTEGQVRDIIDGKQVVAPIREILEVKNAIRTYELYAQLNPFDVNDLLKAHGVMMEALIDDAGKFRHTGVGVFSEQGCIHMAPPPDRVPFLMDDLFEWLNRSKDHLLIRSCVFHYEFEFIHPFADGNGRMGRLWQSLILGKLHPMFEHLPVENMVYTNQDSYYNAIAESSRLGDSRSFIDFMLREILKSLQSHQGTEIEDVADNVADNVADKLTERQRLIISFIKENRILNVAEKVNTKYLSEKLNVNRKTIQRDLNVLVKSGLVTWIGSDRNGYWTLTS